MELGAAIKSAIAPLQKPNITTVSWDWRFGCVFPGRWAMSVLVFSCPETGHEIDPGIEDTGPGEEGARFVALHVRCPHCGEHHEIKIDDDALNEAA